MKRKTRNYTRLPSASKAEMSRARGAARPSTQDSRTKRTWEAGGGKNSRAQRGGGGMGRTQRGGEAPIKGDCAIQCPVIQADERIQGIGQSQELNQGCPMRWIRSGGAAGLS